MVNKIKNIVCNKSNSFVVEETEKYIDKKINEGWDILSIQDSIIIALQNKLHEFNY